MAELRRGRPGGWRKYDENDWRALHFRWYPELVLAYGKPSLQDLSDAFRCSRRTLSVARRELGFGSSGPSE